MNKKDIDRYKSLLLDKKTDLGKKLSEVFSESKNAGPLIFRNR